MSQPSHLEEEADDMMPKGIGPRNTPASRNRH